MAEQRTDLPPGWAYCQIGNVVAYDGIFTDGDWVESKDQDPTGEIRLIQLADIGDCSFHDKSARFLTRAKAIELNCTFLAKGDLLIARMPDPLGRCCIFPLDGEEQYVTVVDVCAVRLGSSRVDPKYMMYVVNSPQMRTDIEALKSGSTRKRISRKNLSTIDLPLAPEAEQHRIVAKIEELFSELDEGIESLNTAKEQLNAYRHAILESSLSANEDQKVRYLPLGDLIGEIQQGWSPKCDPNRPPRSDEWAIIKTTTVQPMQYISNECKPLPDHLKPRPGIEIHDGDLLMTRKGPRPRTGVVCLVRGARNKSMLCDTVYRFRANESLVSPEYLETALNSPSVVAEINAKKSGINESGISLNHGKIKSVQIPVITPRERQDEVVASIRHKLSFAEKLTEEIAVQIARTDALRQSILKQAFAGLLVHQDPSDEPASVLLERLKAEKGVRAAHETKAKESKKRKSKKDAA